MCYVGHKKQLGEHSVSSSCGVLWMCIAFYSVLNVGNYSQMTLFRQAPPSQEENSPAALLIDCVSVKSIYDCGQRV